MRRSNATTSLILMHRGWTRYILPSLLLFTAVLMIWRRQFNKGKPLEPFRVTPPPNRNAVEQLLTLQDAISQVEALIQAGNIILLKLRAVLFAVLPQVRKYSQLITIGSDHVKLGRLIGLWLWFLFFCLSHGYVTL